MRIAFISLLSSTVVASCSAPPVPMLEATFPDATTITYAAVTPDGTPAGLQLFEKADATAPPSWSQRFTATGSADPRAQAELRFGSWAAREGTPLFAMGIIGGELTGPDMEIVRVELTLTRATWTRDPVTPYVFEGTLGSQLPGKVALAPRCTTDATASNYGCGFKPPEGATQASIPWPAALFPRPVGREDGCVGKAYYEDAVNGEPWSWDGQALTVGGGRKLECVVTGSGGLVCHDERQMNLTKDINGQDCGWTVTTLAYPDFSASSSTAHPQLWVLASANDQSVTSACYGFTWCTVGF